MISGCDVLVFLFASLTFNSNGMIVLLADNNQLTTLPESIGNLTSLTTLYLEFNQLTTLPESIGNLTSLTTLYLEFNQLTTLPESIGNLTSLTYLDLDYTDVSCVEARALFDQNIDCSRTYYSNGTCVRADCSFE